MCPDDRGTRGGEQVAEFQQKREATREDPYRPGYHFSPPGGTLHDPNGACYWDGRYHLFYQFWPPHLAGDRPWNEAMHWGHAASEDLLHWKDLPVALAPDPGPEKSCFSGQALVEDDRVVFCYYGPGAGDCIATASDELLVDVEKHPDNPVIPLEEAAPYDVADPCIWQGGDSYYALSGGDIKSRTAAFLFHSRDLADWEYLGPLVADGHHTDPGEDGSVPNFFELDGKHVLLFFSHTRGPQYYVGEYGGGGEFEIEGHGRRNFGSVAHSNLHAPSVLHEGDRRVAFFNVVEGREGWRERPEAGWAGVVSLPRSLSITDGELRSEPVEELTALRTDRRRVTDVPLAPNEKQRFPDLGGRSVELRAVVDIGDADEIELSVLRSPDGEEATTVAYWDSTESLGIDTSRSSVREDVRTRPPEVGPFALASGEQLELRVFVDRSVVEVFANGRQTLTTRVYPDREDSTGVALVARRGRAHLAELDGWEMASIWD